jgi:hypothetical protein
MYRHNRRGGKPVSTLATIRDGTTVYFGIARCNSSKDTFTKAKGRLIAMSRAIKEKAQFPTHGKSYEGITFGPNGLRGMCHVNEVPFLLDHFRAL